MVVGFHRAPVGLLSPYHPDSHDMWNILVYGIKHQSKILNWSVARILSPNLDTTNFIYRLFYIRKGYLARSYLIWHGELSIFYTKSIFMAFSSTIFYIRMPVIILIKSCKKSLTSMYEYLYLYTTPLVERMAWKSPSDTISKGPFFDIFFIICQKCFLNVISFVWN